ncbi:MAG: hypothetical protein P1U34_07885 [Coxiellaceae bacterium]|nr:hypothetical protein [Coxiellaceae bacterium]
MSIEGLSDEDKKNRSHARCYAVLAVIGLGAAIGFLSQFGVCMDKYDYPFGGGKNWRDAWLIQNDRGSDILQITASKTPLSSFVQKYIEKISAKFPDVSIVRAAGTVNPLDRLPRKAVGDIWFNACQYVEFIVQGRATNHPGLKQYVTEAFAEAKNEMPLANGGMASIFYFLFGVVSLAAAAGATYAACSNADKLRGGCRSLLFGKGVRVVPDIAVVPHAEQSTPRIAV